MTKDQIALCKEFGAHGRAASYHYADDSCKEWSLAAERKRKALALFDAHPELESVFRNIAQGFLWSLKRERP